MMTVLKMCLVIFLPWQITIEMQHFFFLGGGEVVLHALKKSKAIGCCMVCIATVVAVEFADFVHTGRR